MVASLELQFAVLFISITKYRRAQLHCRTTHSAEMFGVNFATLERKRTEKLYYKFYRVNLSFLDKQLTGNKRVITLGNLRQA